MLEYSATWFRDHLDRLIPEIKLSECQVSHLFHHFELLQRWNERMDLTSIVTPDEIIGRHYCESLFFGANIPDEEAGRTILDFGSGAGFPGFPVAVLRPDSKVTLLESNQRRAVFLKEASRGLKNAAVAAERGESFAVVHDWVVARAVKPADVLRALSRLATRIGLLAGEASLSGITEATGIQWLEPVKIPWSERRYCVYGRRST